MVYHQDILKIGGGVVISLHHVESITIPGDSDQIIIDRLKDDLLLNLTMVSGKEHCASMASVQQANPFLKDADKLALRSAIYDRWCHLLRS